MSEWKRYPGGRSAPKTEFGAQRKPCLKFLGKDPGHRLILNKAAVDTLRSRDPDFDIPSKVILEFEKETQQIKIMPCTNGENAVSLIYQTPFQYLISAQGFKEWAKIDYWPRNQFVEGVYRDGALFFPLPQEAEKIEA